MRNGYKVRLVRGRESLQARVPSPGGSGAYCGAPPRFSVDVTPLGLGRQSPRVLCRCYWNPCQVLQQALSTGRLDSRTWEEGLLFSPLAGILEVVFQHSRGTSNLPTCLAIFVCIHMTVMYSRCVHNTVSSSHFSTHHYPSWNRSKLHRNVHTRPISRCSAIRLPPLSCRRRMTKAT